MVARNGAVATSQPLAAQAGLQALMDGGNAIDAAVCAAATLSVVEPMSTGIGGDLFSLVWSADQHKVFALNASGRSASKANIEDVLRRNYTTIPTDREGSAMSVSVPGTVDGWHTLLSKFGTMTLKDVLRPAIHYAIKGFGVSELIAHAWQDSEDKLKYLPSGSQLLLNGRAPKLGEIVTLPELGKTLQLIAEGGTDAFYQGDIANSICAFIQQEGGWLTPLDLSKHKSEWVEPINTTYRDATVWECPPNSQGIAALIALNIANNFDISTMGSQSADRYHILAKSMQFGFQEALSHVADPNLVEIPIDTLLSKEYAKKRSADINKQLTSSVIEGSLLKNSDTVYVTAVDSYGNACSLINSLYQGFGSGLVVPDTGIALQNRGALFSLDYEHPNCLAGDKRPYHTIIPCIVTKNGEFNISFGVMGGFQQPQGHLQVVSNIEDFGMTPQESLDALRFSLDVSDNIVLRVEEGIDDGVITELRRRGYTVEVVYGYNRSVFGGGQIISKNLQNGLLIAASEPRKDGCALGW